jgi:hypothetical protein
VRPNANWHVSERALPHWRPLSRASDTESDDDEEWLRDDLLSDGDFDLDHTQHTAHTCRPQGAEADGASTL